MTQKYYDPDIVKFLVIRFSSIGDIVLTTPAVRCLKRQVKDAEVHFLTKEEYFPILKSNPYIDQIHLLRGDNFSELIERLKEENFHYIIDLHKNIRTFRVKQKLRIIAFSFRKLNWQKWLAVNFKINKLPSKHIVDRYLEPLEVFDVKNDNRGLDYFLEKEDNVDLTQIDKMIKKQFTVIVVGGKHKTKQIPEEHIAFICNKLDDLFILLGGKEDYLAAENAVKLTEKKNVINMCGKFSINQSASIIKQAGYVITPDTGLMHIAAAFKKKIITVWGNTIPQFGMNAYQPHPASADFEVKNLRCRPCSKIGYSKCPKKHFKCMHEINYDQLIDYIKRF